MSANVKKTCTLYQESPLFGLSQASVSIFITTLSTLYLKHLIFTSGGVAYDVDTSVATAKVSSGSLDTTTYAAVYNINDATTQSWILKTLFQSVYPEVKKSVFRTQEDAVRQGFSISSIHTRSPCTEYIFLCCSQRK